MEPPSHTSPWSQPFPAKIYKWNGSLRTFRALIEERANENREMTAVLTYVKQQAASALQKKMVIFRSLLGKVLTQEINGDGGSIFRAPAGEHFM